MELFKQFKSDTNNVSGDTLSVSFFVTSNKSVVKILLRGFTHLPIQRMSATDIFLDLQQKLMAQIATEPSQHADTFLATKPRNIWLGPE